MYSFNFASNNRLSNSIQTSKKMKELFIVGLLITLTKSCPSSGPENEDTKNTTKAIIENDERDFCKLFIVDF